MTSYHIGGVPIEISPSTFLEDCIKSISEDGDAIFLIEAATGNTYTYRDLHRKASAVSNKLKELGLKDGDIVTIISHVCPEAIFTIIGVWLSGAATTTINPFLPLEEIQMFIRTCKSRVVYISESLIDEMNEVLEGIDWPVTVITPNGKEPMINVLDLMEGSEDLVTHVDQPLGNDHTITVLFTSGTTGIPKGVIMRDISFKFNACSMEKTNALGERPLLTTPLYWISNPFLLTVALLKHGTVIVTDRPSPEEILQYITKYKVTHIFSGPAVLLDMCKLPDLDKYDTSSLVRVAIGGSVVYPQHRRLICDKLFSGRQLLNVCYGSTEGGIITCDPYEIDSDSPKYASIGRYVPGVTIKVVDQNTGEPLPPYSEGEICVKSPGIIKNYINKILTEDELDSEGFWHMGDIGYYDEDGFLYYVSRFKDVMKYKGQQIAPAELENVIHQHPDVIESAVVGKPSVNGELPTAFVVLKPDASVTEQQLNDFVSKKVIDEKKLRGGIYFVESLPKSTVGKILRNDLKKMLAAS